MLGMPQSPLNQPNQQHPLPSMTSLPMVTIASTSSPSLSSTASFSNSSTISFPSCYHQEIHIAGVSRGYLDPTHQHQPIGSFTVYLIKSPLLTDDGDMNKGNPWPRRRYSDFVILEAYLRRRYPNYCIPPLPGKESLLTGLMSSMHHLWTLGKQAFEGLFKGNNDPEDDEEEDGICEGDSSHDQQSKMTRTRRRLLDLFLGICWDNEALKQDVVFRSFISTDDWKNQVPPVTAQAGTKSPQSIDEKEEIKRLTPDMRLLDLGNYFSQLGENASAASKQTKAALAHFKEQKKVWSDGGMHFNTLSLQIPDDNIEWSEMPCLDQRVQRFKAIQQKLGKIFDIVGQGMDGEVEPCARKIESLEAAADYYGYIYLLTLSVKKDLTVKWLARNLEAKRQQQSPNISEISSDCSLVKRLEHELKVKNEDALQSVNLLGEQCNWVHEHIQRIYLRAIEIKSKTNAQADREARKKWETCMEALEKIGHAYPELQHGPLDYQKLAEDEEQMDTNEIIPLDE